MQDEINEKTIALYIKTGKLTAQTLQKAMKTLLVQMKKQKDKTPQGKQTLKQLMKQNAGVSNIEIAEDNIKAFESTAKKYGIDFALKKDTTESPPRYLVFFKGRDADVLTAAFKEFSAKKLTQEKKPSIRKLLSSLKEKAAGLNAQRDKVKNKDSYDAMVRKILSQEKQPAVALYFTVIKSGHTCEEYMSQVGKAYGLPMISLNNVLSHEFETGRMKWEDYSDDESHPNEWGHKMTADLIMNMFDKATEKIKTMGDVTITPLPDTWVYSDRFADMTFIDRTHSSDKLKISSTGTFDTEKETLISFPDGWSYKGKPSGCEPMEFEFTGKNLMLVYKCNNSAVFGSLQFTVDGEVYTTVATSATDGWSNPVATLAYSGAEGTHKVSIKPVTQSGDDKTTYVEILGFGVA